MCCRFYTRCLGASVICDGGFLFLRVLSWSLLIDGALSVFTVSSLRRPAMRMAGDAAGMEVVAISYHMWEDPPGVVGG